MLENLEQFIGQEKNKSSLLVYINASIIKKTKLDHIFLYAKSGMGKSTLAQLIAKKMNTKIHIYYANNFRKPSDLFSCFSKVKKNEIIFIDEIHRLNKELEEYMFPVLESNTLAINIGKSYSSKIVNVNLSDFTIICATTELHKINEQFLNRFPIFIPFEDYNKKDIKDISKNLFLNYNIEITNDALELFIKNSKKIPRIIENIISRINDYILVEKITLIDKENLQNIFRKINIYDNGICEIDIQYLKAIDNNYCSISTIKQLTNFPVDMILNKIEPNLLLNKYIIKNNKGRRLTDKGKNFLKSLVN